QASGLRYLTRVVHRAWSAAMVCELGRARWLLERAKPPAGDRLRIENALMRLLYQGYPQVEARAGEPVYAFELPLAPVVESWCELVSETEREKREAILTLLDEARQLAAEDSLPDFVELLAANGHEGHIRLAYAIKQRVYTDPSVGPKLWALVEKDARWTGILREADDNLLSLLFEALAELVVRDGNPWRAAVPHMFVITAENAGEPERRRLLFGLTLFASLNAGTTSAIDRLMHGPLRPEFATFASRWHEQLKSLLRGCTPWAASRIRLILPSLVLDPLPET